KIATGLKNGEDTGKQGFGIFPQGILLESIQQALPDALDLKHPRNQVIRRLLCGLARAEGKFSQDSRSREQFLKAQDLPFQSFRDKPRHVAAREWIDDELARSGQKANEEVRHPQRKSCRMHRQAQLPAALDVLVLRARVWYLEQVRRDGAAVVAAEVRRDRVLR